MINTDIHKDQLKSNIERMKISRPLTIFSIIQEYYEKENEHHYYLMKIKVSKVPKRISIVCSAVMYNGVITEKNIKFDSLIFIKRCLKKLFFSRTKKGIQLIFLS